MADRNVESDELGVPQIDETLEILLLQAIEEAQERMEAGSEVVPFTALLNGETVTEDTTPARLRNASSRHVKPLRPLRALAHTCCATTATSTPMPVAKTRSSPKAARLTAAKALPCA